MATAMAMNSAEMERSMAMATAMEGLSATSTETAIDGSIAMDGSTATAMAMNLTMMKGSTATATAMEGSTMTAIETVIAGLTAMEG
jgi:hypothetical protein